MKAQLTLMIGAAAMIAAGTLAAQDQTFNSAEDWGKNKALSCKDGVIKIQGQAAAWTAVGKKFKIDPTKTYTITASVRAVNNQNNEKSLVYVGFNVLDKQGKVIGASNVAVVPGTMTELAANVEKGATTVLVKDGSKFPKGAISIVTDVKEDLSDLPNRNIIANGITSVVQKENGWEITLSRPVYRVAKAGKAVRAHRMGGYMYPAGGKLVGSEWITITGSVKGMNKSGWSNNVWPVGADQAQLVILSNWQKKQLDTEYKDIKLTIK